jgi:6-pyruvoyltetrahydropterin/6-carboxytetrahydropterin synthase
MLVTRVEKLSAVVPEGNGRFRVFTFDVEASIAGDVDPASGMVVNLATMKEAIRREVIARLSGRALDGTDGAPNAATPETLAREIFAMLGGTVAGKRLARVRLVGAPGPIVEWRGGEEMDVTRVYDFSASHRLHAPGLSADENVRVFGKCNNAAGHGHNYGLEVTLRGKPRATGELLPAAEFDRIVASEVVDRWDHRHLNVDVEEFRGVNPTAEEIARIAWRRLAAPLATAAGEGRRLFRIKLRETERNHVEYYGEAASGEAT